MGSIVRSYILGTFLQLSRVRLFDTFCFIILELCFIRQSVGLLGREIGSSQQKAEKLVHAFMLRAVFEPLNPMFRVAQGIFGHNLYFSPNIVRDLIDGPVI
jgi:hypothetical protein